MPSPFENQPSQRTPRNLPASNALAWRGCWMPPTRALLSKADSIFAGELRVAEWTEIDLDAALWTVPFARMKREVQQKLHGSPHLVPLPRQSVVAFRGLHELTGRG